MYQQPEPLIESPSAVDTGDEELLREYAATGAEEVFARLVERHVDLVYSAAFRQTSNHAMAQDVAQAVFTILARKAASLRRETVLSGWLFRAVRYAALDARKIDARRQTREQEAAQMQLTETSDQMESQWEEFAPVLDEALASLGTKDRHAVLLRFFEKKSFGEIGETLGGNENSARVRVVRALDKLRGFFRRRGIAVSATTLSGVLLSNAVQAAPPALAATLVKSAAGSALIEGLLQRLFWRQIVWVGVATLVLLLLTGGATVFVRQRQGTQAAAANEAGAGVRNLMIAIDRTFTLNDPGGFVALVHFRNRQEERLGPVLVEYLRVQAVFRQEMGRVLNSRQRPFDATFQELCFWQPRELPYVRADSAVTNIMRAKYPVRFVKAGGMWKWDMFAGLSQEQCEERMGILRHKTGVLGQLTAAIREGSATDVTEVLEALQRSKP
jgi:RNA polymerase sigma factor (sigma-70 family)